MLTTALERRSGRRWPAVAGAGLVVAALAWYLFPLFTGNDGNVVVLGGVTVETSYEPLASQLRDRGRDTVWASGGASWCDLTTIDVRAAVGDAEVVVLAPDSVGTCTGDARTAAIERFDAVVDDVVVAEFAWWSPNAEAMTTAVPSVNFDVFVGPPGTSDMACEWWDNCEGTVAVRDVEGQLTAAGKQRVARAISAAIG